MTYAISTIAMIVFFACVFIAHFLSGSTLVGTVEALAALVAAIALVLHK